MHTSISNLVAANPICFKGGVHGSADAADGADELDIIDDAADELEIEEHAAHQLQNHNHAAYELDIVDGFFRSFRIFNIFRNSLFLQKIRFSIGIEKPHFYLYGIYL